MCLAVGFTVQQGPWSVSNFDQPSRTNTRRHLLLLVDKLEVLGALQSIVRLVLALDTLQAKHNLLRGLSLLVEHRLSLTTVALLLAVVATLTLCVQRCLASFVLGHFVNGVLLAVLSSKKVFFTFGTVTPM